MYQTQLFTKQEYKILQFLAQGQTNQEMANLLNISTHTIKNHKANMKRKLDIAHTCQLMCYAVAYIKEDTSGSNVGGNILIIRYLTIKSFTVGYMSV
jgi:DNA-binding CsgD family transcriptional regulator